MLKRITILMLMAACTGIANCNLGSTLEDSDQARILFHLADNNTDYILNMNEMHSVFLEFDINGNGQITAEEFIQDWLNDKLGSALEAFTIFNHLDVDRSGFISENPDVPFIFKFFDRDYNGQISQAEFVVQWIKIKSS